MADDVTVVWKDPNHPDDDEGRAVWVCSDGVVGVGYDAPSKSGDPEWTNFTPDEWCAIVEATREVWEREHPSITKMRADVEAMRARGEHVPGEIAQFLKTHPAKGAKT